MPHNSQPIRIPVGDSVNFRAFPTVTRRVSQADVSVTFHAGGDNTAAPVAHNQSEGRENLTPNIELEWVTQGRVFRAGLIGALIALAVALPLGYVIGKSAAPADSQAQLPPTMPGSLLLRADHTLPNTE